MPNALFEAGKLFPIEFEGIDKHIEVAALVAHIGAETDGVIDDDDCETDSKGEDARMYSLVVADSSDDRYNKSRVTRWHVAVGKDILPVPVMFDPMDYELDELGDTKGKDGDNEDGVGIEKFHRVL